ncbi:MAG: TolC family protein [bacterium]|nr:TolC family protein [bacterium]
MSARSILARSLVAALALLPLVPESAHAGQTNAQPLPLMTPAPMPTASGTPMPYPAYGSPAPDITQQQPHAGVPATVTLAQAIDIAVAQSPAFASQRAQYRAIAAKYGAEKGALFPNISGSASITREYGSSGTTTGSSSSSGSGSSSSGTNAKGYFTTETARATLTQLIFDGGRVIAGIHSSKEADIAGRDTLVRQLQTLAFDVATAYYGVLQAKASVDADAALVRQFETQENVVAAQIRTGAAARSDLAAAQFQTAQARGALITAQGAEIGAESTFATTLGLDADTAVTPQSLGSNPAQIKALGYQSSLTEALQLRPDYLAAVHSVASSDANLRFAKLARFPQVDLNASSGTSRTLLSTPNVMTPFSGTGSIGATITVPIYDQGLTNYNVAVAASQDDQAKAALLQSRLTVQSDVRGALANLISARASLVQAKAELQSATVNSQATSARYRVGAATITDIVTANASLATAERDEINALYNERLAEERYTYALGASDLKL